MIKMNNYDEILMWVQIIALAVVVSLVKWEK